MEFSQQELIQIVEQASTLAERMGPQFQPLPVDGYERAIKTRLEQWLQAAAQGHADKFAQRLAWDGLDLDTVRPLLGAVQWLGGSSLPAWTDTLSAILEAAVIPQPVPANLFHPAEPIPFEELLLPFISVARQKLMNLAGSDYALLSEAAHTTLERSLLAQLANVSAQTLNLEFSIFRLARQPGSIQPWGLSTGTASRSLYEAFIQTLVAGQLKELFQKYPVLARLVTTVIDFWVEAHVEFLDRLRLDLPRLQQTFAEGVELGQVSAVQPALSDPHDRGRSVIALQFTSGLKLVHKPRNLGLEVTYFRLLDWLNRHEAPLPFKTLKVLSSTTHGWAEYVSPIPCQDEAEARRYYRRAGMLLAILYALDATDFHFQNIIACGDQPVMIDLDMLITHRVDWFATETVEMSAPVLAYQRLMNSALRTGLVPRWEFGAGQAFDVSGLGAVGEQELQQQAALWVDINTDTMRVGYQPLKIESYSNLPLSARVTLTPAAGDQELIAGFEQMYRLLLAQREVMLSPAGPLAELAQQSPRFMLRNTRGYFNALQRSLQPKFLRNGVDRSIQLDILSRLMLAFSEKPACWPILALEQAALAQLDIPYFSAPGNADSLPLSPTQRLERLFTEPGYERALARLRQLDEADLAWQVEVIQASAYARLAGNLHQERMKAEGERMKGENFHPSREAFGLLPSFLVQQAIEIAAGLEQRAIGPAEGRGLAWLGLAYLPEANCYQFQTLPYDLYSGNGGIALFLAALAHVSGDDRFGRLALSALHPLRQALQTLASAPQDLNLTTILKSATLGGTVGLGSLLYSLVGVSRLLADSTPLAEARLVASLITPERIAADTQFNVMQGAAGAILGLLSLYQNSGDTMVLAQAEACGQHLLAKRTAASTGHQVWPVSPNKFPTGFAHGAAGIAYALLRLDEVSSNARRANDTLNESSSFRDAAAEAIAYEQTLFSPAAGWSEVRANGEPPVFSTGWCHGAAGIGLARLGGLAALDTPAVRQEIETALQVTRQTSLDGVDYLCCGNFGRIELLLLASRCLDRPELLETARHQAAWVSQRAKETGAFRLFPEAAYSIFQPSFFRGTAGIGYQLLRLANPDALPSALLWH